MGRSGLTVLAISILTVLGYVSAVAQQKAAGSAPLNLSIEIGDGRYGRFRVNSSIESYSQISPTEKLPNWKQPAGNLALTGIRLRSVLEGDGVRVKIGAILDDSQPVDAPGPKYGEREEIIASYFARLGDVVTVTEVERFGLRPLKINVVSNTATAPNDKPLSSRAIPKILNDLKSVAVVAIRPGSGSDSYLLVLQNLSPVPIVAATVHLPPTETDVIYGTRVQPIAKPGATFEITVSPRDGPANGVVEAVLFDDDSYEGDQIYAMQMAARLMGREIQLRRLLQLLQQDSAYAGASDQERIQNLVAKVESFRIDVDPEDVTALQGRFPALDGKKREIFENIMQALKVGRSQVLYRVRELEKRRLEEQNIFNLPQSLMELQAEVLREVRTP